MRGFWQKKLLVGGLLGLILVALSLMIAPVSTAEEGVILYINEEGPRCLVLDEFGEPKVVPATRTKLVTTESVNSNATFSCEVKDFGNSLGKAVTIKYGDLEYYPNSFLGCEAPGLLPTTIWHETISAEGDLKLTCQFNLNQF